MFHVTPAFIAGLKAGLAAPIALYAPVQSYQVAYHTFSPAAAFSSVGGFLSRAANEIRPERG